MLATTVCASAFAVALRAGVQDGLQLTLDNELDGVAIDGKTLRGSFSRYEKAVHLLAALDHQLGCVLGQMPVDGKTNEHKTAMELLKSLVLKGRVITGEATGALKTGCITCRM